MDRVAVRQSDTDGAGYDSKYATLYWPYVKIAPVIAHHSTMYCVCGKNMLKQNAHTATPMTAARSAQMCWVGDMAFFFSGRITSWMKMLPFGWIEM